jgi:hypothetical protein
MADRIFPNRIQEEALDSDLVFQGIDWDNFNERLAKAKEPKPMPKEVEDMLKEKGEANKPSEDDTKKLDDVPEGLRDHVKKMQEKAKGKKSEEEVEDDKTEDHTDMVRKSPKKPNKKASVHFTHPSQLSAEAVEAALAAGDKELANTILAARHERRVRLASQIQTRVAAENDKNVKLAQRRAYREQLVKIAEEAEEKDAMNKMCEKCGGKYAGESCEDCPAGKKESGYGKSETEMKKASSLSINAKKAFAAKALAEGFPVEYVEAMLGNTAATDNLKEIKNVMASELESNVKIAAVSSMVKTATLTDADYSRLVDYWKNELGYGDQEWIDALFTKKYDK